MANNLISLAALYVDTGSYEKAEPLYSQSLEILKNTLGPQHSAVAYVLNNLGHLNSKLGDYDKAEAQYQRAISIWENSLGPEHPNVAIAMDNLAIVYELTEDYKLAEPLYTRALKIRETKLGSDHPDVSRTVNNLATLYAFEGDYAKAEQLFKRVLQTKQKTIGIQSISYTNSLINLAWVYQNKNDYVQAKQLYEKAIGIWKDLLGPEHPNVSTGYGHLSDLYLDTGDFENAYPYLYRTLDLDNKIIDQVMGFTSQHQKLKFMAENKWSLYKLLHIVDRHFRNDSSKRKEVFNVWLRRKGSILEAQKRYQETIFQFGDSQSAEIFKELSAIRMKLSKMTLSIPEEELQSYKKQKTGLQNQKEKLEAKLSRLSQDFETKQMISRADSEMVARILPVGTVLLEFARIESDNFKNDRITDRYICFVLHAGNAEQIEMINLGNADAIDGLVEDYKRLISGKFDDGNNKFQEAAHKLYELMFQPVEKYLLRAKKIFISPDGNLSLIPFEVLQGPDGRFLIEDYTFNYLSAGRDIVGFTNNQDAGNKCLLMGNPDFDLRSCDKQAVISKLDVQNTETSFGRRSVNFNEFSFKPLGYAEEELQAIAEIMGAEKTEIYRRGRVRTAACIYPGWSQKPCDEHVESAGQGNYGIDGSVL